MRTITYKLMIAQAIQPTNNTPFWIRSAIWPGLVFVSFFMVAISTSTVGIPHPLTVPAIQLHSTEYYLLTQEKAVIDLAQMVNEPVTAGCSLTFP